MSIAELEKEISDTDNKIGLLTSRKRSLEKELSKAKGLEHDSDFYWDIIESLKWESDHDYSRVKTELVGMNGSKVAEKTGEFAALKQTDLQKRFHNDWLGDPGIEGSDDGWSDLTAEVVGRGKDFYNSITVSKLQELALNGDYEENFSYSFH